MALVVDHSTSEVFRKELQMTFVAEKLLPSRNLAGCLFASNHDSSVGRLWNSFTVVEGSRDVLKRLWWSVEFGLD